MDEQHPDADGHRRKAREYLDQAQGTTDLEKRQELLNLCEQELQAAVTARKRIWPGTMSLSAT